MARTGKWLRLIAGAGLVVAGAQSVQAQATAPEALENGAVALLQTSADYRFAADMYRKAASLRGTEDAAAVEDMRMAGLLYAQAGDLRRAGPALEAAGERAMTQGDPGAAAQAYTDAAFVAARAGSLRFAVLAHRALWLAGMDAVTDAQRAHIRHRLAPTMVASTAK